MRLTSKVCGGVLAIVVLFFGFGVSCRDKPTIANNSNVVAQPGRGITNLCELGMNFTQLRRTTRDAKEVKDELWSWKRFVPWRKVGRFVVIPSLGAITYLPPDQPMTSVSFYVLPHDNGKLLPELSIHQPFRGMVGTLSFKDGQVSRARVESSFGRVDAGTTNSWDKSEYPTKDVNIAYWVKRDDHHLQLHYPAIGLTFQLVSNVVTSFQIYKATGTNG